MIAMPSFAQRSRLDVSASGRIGIEPFFALNATCASGEVITVASRFCALIASALVVFGNTNTSPATMYGDFGPKPGKQPKSLPGTCFAAENSPFAQSPMICTPALPEITSAVASFQLLPGEPGST